MNTRIAKWDNAKFLLIFLVILGHLLNQEPNKSFLLASIEYWIYLFHMPAFIFITGMFSKKNINNKSFWKIFQFLWLYLISKVLIFFSYFFVYHKAGFSFFSESNIPWYCLAIFIFQLVTIFLKDFNKKNVFLLTIFIGLLAGYDSSIGSFLSLSRIFVFFPFFYLGYITESKFFIDKTSAFSVKLFSLVIVTGSILLTYFTPKVFPYIWGLLTAQRSYKLIGGSYVVFGGVYRLIYYFLSFSLLLALLILIPNTRTFFTSIGQKTLQIYIFHLPILKILTISFSLTHWISQLIPFRIITLLLTACIILATCLSKILSKLTKKLLMPKKLTT